MIVAGRSLEPVDDTLAAVIPLLAVAVPLLVALVALTTWIVTGRALTPVERMRREVDEITGTSLDRRVRHSGDDDEISRLAATMKPILDRLERAQTTQRQFISDASHELESPLASLRQFAEVATQHPDRISAAELTEAILDEGARLERLVNGMLVLAKADESSLAGSARPVDLDDLVLAEARRLRMHAHLTVDAGGSGLGLAIVRELVRAHGGAVTVTDSALGGARCEVRLPPAPDH